MGTSGQSVADVFHHLRTRELRHLTKNGLLLLFGEAANALAALALGYAFANLLPKETFGQYKYLLSVVSVLGAFSLSGLAVALSRSAARGYDAALRRVFTVHLLSHGPMALATLATSGYYYLKGNHEFGLGLGIAALAQPIINSAMLCLPFLQSKEQYGRASLSAAAFGLIPAAVLVGALVLTDDLLLVLVAYFASNALVAAVLYRLTVRRYPADAPSDPSLMRYGVHLTIQQIPASVTEHIDKILLFQLLGPSALAVYTFATAIPMQIRSVMRHAYTLAFPRFARLPREKLKGSFFQIAAIMFVLSIPVTVGYVVLAPHLFRILFPAYMEAVPYSQWFSLTFLFGAGGLASAYFSAQGIVRGQYISVFLNSALTIAALVAGIALYGLAGAIAARILVKVVLYFVELVIISKT
jgi:O-antigen/teichoic acid export membrane protein